MTRHLRRKQRTRHPCSPWVLILLWGAFIGLWGKSSAQSQMAIRLNDLAAEAAVTLLIVSGGLKKHLILTVAGTGAGFFSHNDTRVHFELGDCTEVRRPVEPRPRPSGLVEVFENVKAD